MLYGLVINNHRLYFIVISFVSQIELNLFIVFNIVSFIVTTTTYSRCLYILFVIFYDVTILHFEPLYVSQISWRIISQCMLISVNIENIYTYILILYIVGHKWLTSLLWIVMVPYVAGVYIVCTIDDYSLFLKYIARICLVFDTIYFWYTCQIKLSIILHFMIT